jgi:hypothetical protein
MLQGALQGAVWVGRGCQCLRVPRPGAARGRRPGFQVRKPVGNTEPRDSYGFICTRARPRQPPGARLAAPGRRDRRKIALEQGQRAGSHHLINGCAGLAKRRKQGADNKTGGAACASARRDSGCRGSSSSGQCRAMGTVARYGQAAVSPLPLLLRRTPERRRPALRGLHHSPPPRITAISPISAAAPTGDGGGGECQQMMAAWNGLRTGDSPAESRPTRGTPLGSLWSQWEIP